MDRRDFLAATGAVAFRVSGRALFPSRVVAAESGAKADFTRRNAPVSVERAPGKVAKTIGYNGTVPGPTLRMQEGISTTIDVFNDTDSDELVPLARSGTWILGSTSDTDRQKGMGIVIEYAGQK